MGSSDHRSGVADDHTDGLRRSAVESRIAELVEPIRSFCSASGLSHTDLSDRAQCERAEVIATFACLCAPPCPSSPGTMLAARLTSIFFFLDDVAKDRLGDYVQGMLHLVETAALPVDAPTPVCALASYLDDLQLYGSTARFRAQFRDFLLALIEEEQRLRAGPMSLASYREMRHRIIFVEEYLWTWIVSEKIPIDDGAIASTISLRRLASEAVYLVNDIGSVSRERAAGEVDPNLVFILARERGLSHEDALERVCRLHDEVMRAYRLESRQILSRQPSRGLELLVVLIDGVVRGNLLTTKRLSESRYPESMTALVRLDAL